MRPLTRILSVCLLVSVSLLATIGTTHAASVLKSIGCAKEGFTMQVPTVWSVGGDCSPNVVVFSNTGEMWMNVRIRPHAYWNQTRAKGEVRAEIAATPSSDVAYNTFTVGTHHFFYGIMVITASDGVQEAMYDANTFQSGYSYDFFAAYVLSTDPSTTLVAAGNGAKANPQLPALHMGLLSALWRTIHITRM